MGLVRAVRNAAGGVLADQWKEFFYCEAIPNDVLVTKGMQRQDSASVNVRGSDNLISSGSVIAVADGQAMAIVEQGAVVEFAAEPGEFIFDSSTEPSIFSGGLGQGILDSFATLGRRVTFGGGTGKDQRVYYFNLKEITGNKYGTPNPIPFRVVDENIGLDIDISIRCHGKYSYRLTDPLLFYTNVSGNVQSVYRVADLDAQLKSELLAALQPAFAQISAKGVRYSALPGYAAEIGQTLNDLLSEKWGGLRGIEIVTFNIKSVTAPPEDEQLIKELQRKAVLRNADMAGATLVGAQADAMRAAAGNEAGAMMGFMGMNAALGAGAASGAQQFFDRAAAQGAVAPAPAAPAAAAPTWTCQCGAQNTGRFCPECGNPQPAPATTWTCQCGAQNTGRFCPECGTPQPAPASVPEDWTCTCGTENTGRFCANCGTPRA